MIDYQDLSARNIGVLMRVYIGIYWQIGLRLVSSIGVNISSLLTMDESRPDLSIEVRYEPTIE